MPSALYGSDAQHIVGWATHHMGAQMIKAVLAVALLMSPSLALAQSTPVPQTGSVSVNGQYVAPTPTTQFNQSCNGGAGGIVGQLGTGSYSAIVCAAPSTVVSQPVTVQQPTASALNVQSAGLPIATASSPSTEACHTFKTSSGALISVSGYVSLPATIFILDRTTPPPNGPIAVKIAAISVQAAGTWSASYAGAPASFSSGLTVCASSSTDPFTMASYLGTASFSGQVQ